MRSHKIDMRYGIYKKKMIEHQFINLVLKEEG
jgi:hypothetical protein